MATNCLFTGGYSLGCKDNTGGIQEVYIANFSGNTTYVYDSNNVITGITSAPTYYTFEQRNENAELLQEGQHSVENGTNFWLQTLNLIFHKNESDSRNLVLLLAKAQLSVIALDQNGKYWILGKRNGADLTTSNSNFGKAYGDLNGSNISIVGKEPEPMNEISVTAFNTLTVE